MELLKIDQTFFSVRFLGTYYFIHFSHYRDKDAKVFQNKILLWPWRYHFSLYFDIIHVTICLHRYKYFHALMNNEHVINKLFVSDKIWLVTYFVIGLIELSMLVFLMLISLLPVDFLPRAVVTVASNCCCCYDDDHDHLFVDLMPLVRLKFYSNLKSKQKKIEINFGWFEMIWSDFWYNEPHRYKNHKWKQIYNDRLYICSAWNLWK